MALTSAAELALRRAGLDKVFGKQRKMWLAMAKEAYRYTSSTVVGGKPMPDDVAQHLIVALESGEAYSKAAGKHIAKHWYRDFADLIINRTWPELSQGEESSHASNEGSNSGPRPAARAAVPRARPSRPERAG
jgi:hypothetical protein